MDPAAYLLPIERAHMLAMLDLTAWGILALALLTAWTVADWRTR